MPRKITAYIALPSFKFNHVRNVIFWETEALAESHAEKSALADEGGPEWVTYEVTLDELKGVKIEKTVNILNVQNKLSMKGIVQDLSKKQISRS